jgi:hypothetical protein
MSTFTIVAIGVGYVVFVGFLLLVVQAKNRTQRVNRIAHSVGLPLTVEIEPTVRRTLRVGVRIGFTSIVIGAALATAYILLAHINSTLQMFWIDFTGVMAGIGIGSALATFTGEDSRQKSSVRVARLQTVTLSDYRSAFDQWAPRIVVVVSLLGLALRGAIYPAGYGSVPVFLWIYASVTVASLAIYEVATRALLRTGQPANSALDLAWDDALRSQALAGIATMPIYLGAYLGLPAFAFYPPTHVGATALGSQVESVFQLVGIALLLVWLGASIATKSQQRYLRRLWPDLPTAREVSRA